MCQVQTKKISKYRQESQGFILDICIYTWINDTKSLAWDKVFFGYYPLPAIICRGVAVRSFEFMQLRVYFMMCIYIYILYIYVFILGAF